VLARAGGLSTFSGRWYRGGTYGCWCLGVDSRLTDQETEDLTMELLRWYLETLAFGFGLGLGYLFIWVLVLQLVFGDRR
jgi:hypothetical protein